MNKFLISIAGAACALVLTIGATGIASADQTAIQDGTSVAIANAGPNADALAVAKQQSVAIAGAVGNGNAQAVAQNQSAAVALASGNGLALANASNQSGAVAVSTGGSVYNVAIATNGSAATAINGVVHCSGVGSMAKAAGGQACVGG